MRRRKRTKKQENKFWDDLTNFLLIAGLIVIGIALLRVPFLLGCYLVGMALLLHEVSKETKKEDAKNNN